MLEGQTRLSLTRSESILLLLIKQPRNRIPDLHNHSFIWQIVVGSCYKCWSYSIWHIWDKRKIRTEFWWGYLKERDHLKDVDVDRKAILKLALSRKHGMAWTDFTHFIHSFSILSDDRSKASSKTMPPYSAMQSLLLQMRISSPVLKVIQ